MLQTTETVQESGYWPRTFRALRHRNFRLFWLGQVVSITGTWMQVVAQGWLVYRLTDSALLLGLVNVVGLLPVIPISLLAGIMSDRLPRKNLILATETVLLLQALALAALTWLDLIQIWHIIILSFILGAASTMEQPARMAFVLDVTGKDDLTNAIALNSSIYNLGRIVGPSIAGLTVALSGESGCFLINALSYLAVIAALLAIRLPHQSAPKTEIRVARGVADGLHYAWKASTVRDLFAIVAVSSFFSLPYLTLMPVFARDLLGLGPEGLGYLMTGVGAGAVAGALGVASIEEGSRGKWLLASNILGPIFLILFCLSRSFVASIGIVVLVGVFNSIRQALANSLVQLNAQEEYHGRVMSVYNLLFNGMSRVGSLGIGGLTEITGIAPAVGLGALVNLIWGFMIAWKSSSVRRLS